MSSTTEPIRPTDDVLDETEGAAPAEQAGKPKKNKSPIDVVLDFLSSVKVGVTLLAIMIVATAIGTFIIQKGTSGFREYYQQLLPAEKALYTTLGFLDVYHTWWFNLLLLTVSLNIILASIDYFPAAWRYIKKPVLKINQAFIKRQPYQESIVLPAGSVSIENIRAACEAVFLQSWAKGPLRILSSVRVRVTENSRDKSTTIYADKSVWNRLMAYAIHAALLTIFAGAFVGGQFGHKGVVRLAPGIADDKFISQGADENSDEEFRMPFQLFCTDIQQDLLDPKKMDLSAPNTLDWHTRVIFRYKNQDYAGHIHLNNPIDFRGYRFFQASFDNVGSARTVALKLTPTKGGGAPREVSVSWQPTTVPGIGTLKLVGFYPDFAMNGGQPDTASGDYNKPVAEIEWTPESGTPSRLWAFPQDIVENLAANAPVVAAKTLLNDYRVGMGDFEKVSAAHILQVQYDPGVDTVYLGCALLTLFLWMVFFFSHQRMWVLVEPLGDGTTRLSLTGNTNRNRQGFEKRFNLLAGYLTGKTEASGE
ncbi:MAG: cytochrome c biogenesis protein ResB [Blastocatellia bacterium]|nr:cytochrome c biogenesis protein ResB [Blastocatellia bacterium]